MGSTPSALPAHYRSSHAAQDGYQGNGLDSHTGMTHSGGGSIEHQSVGGAPATLVRSRSAKGSKADKIAAAIAAGAAAAAAEASSSGTGMGSAQTGRLPARREAGGAGSASKHKPAASMEFSVHGSNSAASASSAAAAAASAGPAASPAAAAVPSSSSKPRRGFPAPSPSPARSVTPPPEESDTAADSTDHASYFETRILKPMPEYADSQFRELAHVITR